MVSYALKAEGISKKFAAGNSFINLLSDVSIEVKPGELVSVTGKSGSGKSTLLYMLSGLLRPDNGHVFINGSDVYVMNEKRMSELRNREIGFVFQNAMLLDELTVEENIMLPAEIAGLDVSSLRSSVRMLAERIGIIERFSHKVGSVSGGEKSRTALLRAIVMNPLLVFLDEPTGALDNANAALLEDLIVSLSSDLETAFVYVTHDEAFASRADRVFEIRNGSLLLRNDDTASKVESAEKRAESNDMDGKRSDL